MGCRTGMFSREGTEMTRNRFRKVMEDVRGIIVPFPLKAILLLWMVCVNGAAADSTGEMENVTGRVILEAGEINPGTVEKGAFVVVVYGRGERDPVSGGWNQMHTERGYVQAVDAKSLVLVRRGGGNPKQIVVDRIKTLVIVGSSGKRPEERDSASTTEDIGGNTVESPASESLERDFEHTEADSSQIWKIETSEGSSITGRILESGDTEIVVSAKSGVIEIPVSEIVMMEKMAPALLRDGEVWFKSPNPTRLFVGPTARMLKQGEGYFSNYYFFLFPGLTMGLTNILTLGAGVSVLPGVDLEDQLFYFGSKAGIIPDRLAAGVLVLRDPSDDNPPLGVLFGVMTIGQPDGSLSAGFGYGFFDGKLIDRPAMMIGVEKRLSEHISLVSENYIFPYWDWDPLVSYGIRFFGRRLSVDLGFLNQLGGDGLSFGFPYFDFVFAFDVIRSPD